MQSPDRESRRRTLISPLIDMLFKCSRSLAPNQSASRQDSRNRGRPIRSSLAQILSNGVRPSSAPARISSSPSMNSVVSRHSDLSSYVVKSRAVT